MGSIQFLVILIFFIIFGEGLDLRDRRQTINITEPLAHDTGEGGISSDEIIEVITPVVSPGTEDVSDPEHQDVEESSSSEESKGTDELMDEDSLLDESESAYEKSPETEEYQSSKKKIELSEESIGTDELLSSEESSSAEESIGFGSLETNAYPETVETSKEIGLQEEESNDEETGEIYVTSDETEEFGSGLEFSGSGSGSGYSGYGSGISTDDEDIYYDLFRPPPFISEELIKDSSKEFSFEKSEENEEPLKAMCTHTYSQPNPWWRVDLQDTYVVEKIVVYNRAQGYHGRLHDISIRVGMEDIPTAGGYYNHQFLGNELCALRKGILPPGENVIDCNKPVEGRFVSIQIIAGNYNYLTLCEVQVYGSSLQKPFGNAALKKPVLQSGVSWKGIPERAVDGIISAQFLAGEEHMSCMNIDESYYDTTSISPLPNDCADIYHQGKRRSGVYTIFPKSWMKAQPFKVFCDMSTDGGGWTTILRRHYYLDHSESFHRFLKDYVEGFGELCEEFWIGNDNLYVLTTQNAVHLKVEIHNSYGEDLYAFYERFMISDEQKLYTMHVHGYEGNAGDYLKSDVPFTMRREEGGWWWTEYSEDSHTFLGSNPNGYLWHGSNVSEPVTWGCQQCHKARKNDYIQFFDMKIRPVWFEYLIRYGGYGK